MSQKNLERYILDRARKGIQSEGLPEETGHSWDTSQGGGVSLNLCIQIGRISWTSRVSCRLEDDGETMMAMRIKDIPGLSHGKSESMWRVI